MRVGTCLFEANLSSQIDDEPSIAGASVIFDSRTTSNELGSAQHQHGAILWMHKILGNHAKPVFVCIYRGIIRNQGL